MSWTRSLDGREKHTGSGPLDASGDVPALAHATWIELRC
jgi:hypothetical protein